MCFTLDSYLCYTLLLYDDIFDILVTGGNTQVLYVVMFVSSGVIFFPTLLITIITLLALGRYSHLESTPKNQYLQHIDPVSTKNEPIRELNLIS